MKKESAAGRFWSSPVTAAAGSLFGYILLGSAVPCIKIGYGLFAVSGSDTPSMILFAGLRFVLAGLMVLLYGTLRGGRFPLPKGRAWLHVGAVSFAQTVGQYFFFYIGVAHATGAKSTIIVCLGGFISILLSSLAFRMEKLTSRKVLGCALGIGGVALITLSKAAGGMSFSLLGDGMMLMSTVLAAFSSVFMKRYAGDDPVLLSGWQFFLGGLVMTLAALLAGGRLTTQSGGAVPMLVYLAFVSAASFTIRGVLLKYHPVSRILIYGFANPMFGVLLSALVLKERIGAPLVLLASLALVSAGILLVNLPGRKKAAR